MKPLESVAPPPPGSRIPCGHNGLGHGEWGTDSRIQEFNKSGRQGSTGAERPPNVRQHAIQIAPRRSATSPLCSEEPAAGSHQYGRRLQGDFAASSLATRPTAFQGNNGHIPAKMTASNPDVWTQLAIPRLSSLRGSISRPAPGRLPAARTSPSDRKRQTARKSGCSRGNSSGVGCLTAGNPRVTGVPVHLPMDESIKLFAS